MATTYRAPSRVRSNARRALEQRAALPPSRRGMTAVGVRRAVQLRDGEPVSLDTVRRMVAYFDRHEPDRNATGFRRGEQGYPSKGRQAWDGWGGDAGRAWALRTLRREDPDWWAGRRRRARAK